MHKHTNALIHEASPYLLQHAHNPVDWQPWGDAAFERAVRENKPVFLSIGYAACHWCHVMERESFEDENVAAFLNQHFVSIKVDREERPDVDHHFMEIVQAVTGGGGWPMSVFLTPERRAFYGGTYWPPRALYGRPAFSEILRAIHEAWSKQHAEVLESAAEIAEHLSTRQLSSTTALPTDLAAGALRAAAARFDHNLGGFSAAPKFPHAMELGLLLQLASSSGDALEMALLTLTKMACGGIYDQVGGGFHRYATDAAWRIPHFEKMLYDNALLIPVYLDAFVLTDNAFYREIAAECMDWVLREMEMPEGGFASSLDADSEGREGAFYVWSASEIEQVLGAERGAAFSREFSVTSDGNFEEGKSILYRSSDAGEQRFGLFKGERNELLKQRNLRLRPARDDKVLTDWNGLMIRALVRGYAVIGEQCYLDSATQCAQRILRQFEKNALLPHSLLGDRVQSTQFLLDYAAFTNALLDIYLVTGEASWFDTAVTLVERFDPLFANSDGPYFMSNETVGGRIVTDIFDNTTPSGIASAALALTRLHELTGASDYRERAERQLLAYADSIARMPAGFSAAIAAVLRLRQPPAIVVIAGDSSRELWRELAARPSENTMLVYCATAGVTPTAQLAPLLSGKKSTDGKPTAYVCHDFVCESPVHTAAEVQQLLGRRNSADVVA